MINMNSKQFTDIIFKAARGKKNEEKIKYITNAAIGYLEANLSLAKRQEKPSKQLQQEMSNHASTIQIIEKLQDKYLKLMKQNPNKKNIYIKEYYGRISSVFKKLKFTETEKISKKNSN